MQMQKDPVITTFWLFSHNYHIENRLCKSSVHNNLFLFFFVQMKRNLLHSIISLYCPKGDLFSQLVYTTYRYTQCIKHSWDWAYGGWWWSLFLLDMFNMVKNQREQCDRMAWIMLFIKQQQTWSFLLPSFTDRSKDVLRDKNKKKTIGQERCVWCEVVWKSMKRKQLTNFAAVSYWTKWLKTTVCFRFITQTV